MFVHYVYFGAKILMSSWHSSFVLEITTNGKANIRTTPMYFIIFYADITSTKAAYFCKIYYRT
jgi:hypothetical protein